MKRFAALVALATLLASYLPGQQTATGAPDSSTLQPTTSEVLKFMEVMQVRHRLESMAQTQQEGLKTRVHNVFSKALPDATPSEKAKFEEIAASTLGDLFTNYPVDDVLRDMIPIYQSHFSESDLNQIVAFYSSPVGQKVLKEMPAMSAESMRVSDNRMQPKIDEAMKNLDARIREMVNAENGSGK
jgi:hypothetical protein